jgi:hypothetical protein
MDRREFLIGCGVAAVSIPLTVALNGCGGGGGTTTPATGTGFTITSNPGQFGHNHTVTILFNDLTTQPAAGVNYTTSAGGSPSHTHQLIITQGQLNDINGGKSDNISTVIDATAHTHEFTIVKPA